MCECRARKKFNRGRLRCEDLHVADAGARDAKIGIDLLNHRRAPRARNLRHLRRRFGRHRV